MSGASVVTTCQCGCGEKTAYGRMADLADGVRTRSQIAAELGWSTAYLKALQRQPPLYLKGHKRGTNQVLVAGRIETLRQNAVKHRQVASRMASWAKSPNGQGQMTLMRARRAKAQVADVRAADLLLLLPFIKAPPTRFTNLWLPQSMSRSGEGRWDPQIDWLREQVGLGWRRDAPAYDPRLLSLDAIREDHGDDFFWFQHQQEEREQLEREWGAAAEVMRSGPLQTLVRVALATPQNLTEGERDALRLHYERALAGERLPSIHSPRIQNVPDARRPRTPPFRLAADAPVSVGGGGLKRGRGNGRRRVVSGVGQKRFEGKEQIAFDRALREQRQMAMPA